MKLVKNIAVLEGDQCISKWVEDTGRLDHDQWLLPKLKERITNFGTCMDVGAYIGDHTIAYAQWFKHVWAFEPNPAAFECLKHNMDGLDHVLPRKVAVGEGFEDIYLQIPENNPGAAQIVRHDTGIPVMWTGRMAPIPVDFIKIDAEGAELSVLLALEDSIEQFHPQMLIEQRSADGNEKLIRAFLNKHGYAYASIQGVEGEQYDLWCE